MPFGSRVPSCGLGHPKTTAAGTTGKPVGAARFSNSNIPAERTTRPYNEHHWGFRVIRPLALAAAADQTGTKGKGKCRRWNPKSAHVGECGVRAGGHGVPTPNRSQTVGLTQEWHGEQNQARSGLEKPGLVIQEHASP